MVGHTEIYSTRQVEPGIPEAHWPTSLLLGDSKPSEKPSPQNPRWIVLEELHPWFSCVHAYTGTYTHVHAHIHTYMHTLTHACTL